MNTKQLFIVAVLVFSAFTAGIYVGSHVAQACAIHAIHQATLYKSQIRAMRMEIEQMREEYLKIIEKEK